MVQQDIPEVIGILLNLAEFMEHVDRGPLQLDTKILAERAMKCRAFAKALHYKEDEFHKGPTTEVLESLISINNKLQQSEAAQGVLEYAMKNQLNEVKVKERWYEKLHDWDNALRAYQSKYEQNRNDFDAIVGQMRCLEVLSEWTKLNLLAQQTWPTSSPEQKQKMARMAATAAWGLGLWDQMEEYTQKISSDLADSAFYQAILQVHHDNYEQAQCLIDKARKLIGTDLTTMASESYSRAYSAMVQVQMMSELEEVVQYKLVPERREMIKEKWWQRLQGCQRVVEDWQKILQVHSLVLKPHEDMRSWLKFAKLCQRTGRLQLSYRTLVSLLETDSSNLGKL